MTYVHQLAKAIVAALRARNSLAEIMLDEFFEVFKNEDDAVYFITILSEQLDYFWSGSIFFYMLFLLINLLGLTKLGCHYTVNEFIKPR